MEISLLQTLENIEVVALDSAYVYNDDGPPVPQQPQPQLERTSLLLELIRRHLIEHARNP